jgi:beta-glucosidase
MLSSLLPLAALLAPAFGIVEPLNTTILGPYGFAPPVYPSRKF